MATVNGLGWVRTTYPDQTVTPPPKKDENLPLVIGLCAMAGVGLLIAIVTISVVCIRRKKKLADKENEKTIINAESADNNCSVSSHRSSRHKSGNESNFDNLERLSKMKRSTRNQYETKEWERQYQGGASNFVTQIPHNEEQEDLSKYLIDSELAEYNKVGHEQVSLTKGTTSDDAGYDHIENGAASVIVMEPSGKMVKEGKDLAKHMIENDMVEYDKLGSKKTFPPKLTTSDDAGYDHINVKADDRVTIIDPGNGQVFEQKGPKSKTPKSASEESPYDMALGEESLYDVAQADNSAKETDDPYTMANDETANGKYEESLYNLAESENNNVDIYDVAADVNPVKPLSTFAKATGDPMAMAKGEEDGEYAYIADINDEVYDVAANVNTIKPLPTLAKVNDGPSTMAEGEEDGEYAYIPDINDEVYDTAADVNTTDSPYDLAKDAEARFDEDNAYDVAVIVKAVRPALPLPKVTNDIYNMLTNDNGVYDVTADGPYMLPNDDPQTREYDSLGNTLLKVSNEMSDGTEYDHIPKFDSKVVIVGLGKPGIHREDQNGKAMDEAKEECPYDLPEDVVEEELEDPYAMADDEEIKNRYEDNKPEDPYAMADDEEIKNRYEDNKPADPYAMADDEEIKNRYEDNKPEDPYSTADDEGIKNGYGAIANNIRMSKVTSTVQGLMTEESLSRLAREAEDPYALAEGEDASELAKDDEKIYENDVAHGDSQETDSIDQEKDGYYNTTEIMKKLKLNGHSQLRDSALVKNEICENLPDQKETLDGTNSEEGENSPLNRMKVTGRILMEENSLYEKSQARFPKLVNNECYEHCEATPANDPKLILMYNPLYEKAPI